MKKVKEMFARLSAAQNFKTRYPEFDMEDSKIHVLFLSPCLNEAGYYRMILPALELNRTDSHKAITAHIHKWDFTKLFDDYDSPVDRRLIEWADYVVIPAMFSDMSYILKNIRDINSDITFVMDLDLNYHELPEYHPDYFKLNPELKETLLKNLSLVDILTAPNTLILNYYRDLVSNHDNQFSLHFERYANLLSNFTYAEIREFRHNSGAKVRIGLILDPSQVTDLKIIEQALATLLKKHTNNIEVLIYGSSKTIVESCELLKEFILSFTKSVCFEEYHNKLNFLALDIGLLPFENNSFNTSGKSLNRFLDFSANMIPVVASNIIPFKKIITDGENGLIASNDEEWISKIDELITNSQLRKEMGNTAFKLAWENFSYTPKTIQRLRSIFI